MPLQKILSDDEVLQIAVMPTDEKIDEARSDSDLLIAHRYGHGFDKLIEKIQNLENATQLDLRKRYTPSNVDKVESLLRPIDNVWSARGGDISLNVPDGQQKEKFIDFLSNFYKGKSVKDYLKNVFFDRFITDPNGLLFFEISGDGENIYPTYKSIESIKNMELLDIRPNWLCYEPVCKPVMTLDGEYYTPINNEKITWVIDGEKYVCVVITEIDEKGQKNPQELKQIARELFRIPNTFGYVPAIINSPIFDTCREIQVSPIHNQLELLNNYLVKNSVHQVYQFLHGYPIYWRYTTACPMCKGVGKVPGLNSGQNLLLTGNEVNRAEAYRSGNSINPTGVGDDKLNATIPFAQDQTCPNCGGLGYVQKKDVSDGIALEYDTNGEGTLPSPIAGYVSPDLDTWREQRTELERVWSMLYMSHWNTIMDNDTKAQNKDETATGRIYDAQAINTRLNAYSDILETAHKAILDICGDFLLGESYKGAIVSYGREYLTERPDVIWKSYLQSKKDGAPISELDMMLMQYYETKFKKNERLQEYYRTLLVIEPFIHSTTEKVLSLPIPDQWKDKKIWFSEWIKTLDRSYIINTDTQTLLKELDNFVNENKLTDEQRRINAEANSGIKGAIPSQQP